MSAKLQHIKNLRRIFYKSVESVRPVNLLSAVNGYCLQPEIAADSRNVSIQIQGKTFDISQKQCHVVGFGKAVLGMAVQLERVLQQFLVGGLLSIPRGTLEQFKGVAEMQLSANTKIEVLEGAPNNQPDATAMEAAKRIMELASGMTERDILFVLISGGGSALLPLPRAPLTLEEKMQLVRRLANAGASIDEMNVVRIALSGIKGGRLAAAARRAHAVISFVISDIVGDPIDLIASGPTCASTATAGKRATAAEVLRKYDMWTQLPNHIQQLIEMPVEASETHPGANNQIYVVGNNRVACAAAVQEALSCDYIPFIVSTSLQGEVQQLVQQYDALLRCIGDFRYGNIDEKELQRNFPFDSCNFEEFLKTLRMSKKTCKPLLLILAGEPTVKVAGSGLGGRNQELALCMSLLLHRTPKFADFSFLSAGTDGIDGPTPAAGAIGDATVVDAYLRESGHTLEQLQKFLLNNDSYNFYKELQDGSYHVLTGHTGTNVMDLQSLLLP